jgi:hypothetical protein
MNFTITKHTVRRGLAAVSAGLASRVKNLPSAMLLIVAMVYLLPLSGVLGSDTVALLYGLRFGREIVFYVAFLIFCAFTPSWRSAAYIGAFLTGVGALYTPGYSTLAANTSIAEVFALGCLVIGGIALGLEWRSRGERLSYEGHPGHR